MKKNNLTLEQLETLFKNSMHVAEKDLIGFIGKNPVYSNPNCPPGVIYMLNEEEFKKL